MNLNVRITENNDTLNSILDSVYQEFNKNRISNVTPSTLSAVTESTEVAEMEVVSVVQDTSRDIKIVDTELEDRVPEVDSNVEIIPLVTKEKEVITLNDAFKNGQMVIEEAEKNEDTPIHSIVNGNIINEELDITKSKEKSTFFQRLLNW